MGICKTQKVLPPKSIKKFKVHIDIWGLNNLKVLIVYYSMNGHTQAPRFREGIERFFVTDINNPAATAQGQASLAVMWDAIAPGARMFNHVPGGCNVLFFDGHVDFLRYNESWGIFPVNEAGVQLHKANHMLNGTSMGGM